MMAPCTLLVLVPALTAVEHYQRGVSHLSSGAPLRAAVELRRALDVDPSSHSAALPALNAVGEGLFEQGDLRLWRD